ncbi:hypothetical protein [Pedobacter sp. Hv1]|uniref:hypothetical protein n=1 Tax=Pedobacter sp. Hv1 TaxID=1740090 RepID=UPI0006D8C06D|nr:hypothetical protein [Pedobacter sp. Hv1]KQC02690.1 hypothetical protein AQF98_03700 [Pedobacter sp. Hv1]
MKKTIQVLCLFVIVVGVTTPISASKNNHKVIKIVKKQTMVDFVAYNSTSTTAWVYLYNTVTDEGNYYSVPANTPSHGTVIGQIPYNDDIYTGTVQLEDASYRTIQLYHARGVGINTLNGTDLAIGCGACAFVSID